VAFDFVVGEAVEPDLVCSRVVEDLAFIGGCREAGEEVQAGGDAFGLGGGQVAGERVDERGAALLVRYGVIIRCWRWWRGQEAELLPEREPVRYPPGFGDAAAGVAVDPDLVERDLVAGRCHGPGRFSGRGSRCLSTG
jgi:hypothetical protein